MKLDGVKKITLLSLVLAFIILTAYVGIKNNTIPNEFVTIFTVVIGFYFGKGNKEGGIK